MPARCRSSVHASPSGDVACSVVMASACAGSATWCRHTHISQPSGAGWTTGSLRASSGPAVEHGHRGRPGRTRSGSSASIATTVQCSVPGRREAEVDAPAAVGAAHQRRPLERVAARTRRGRRRATSVNATPSSRAGDADGVAAPFADRAAQPVGQPDVPSGPRPRSGRRPRTRRRRRARRPRPRRGDRREAGRAAERWSRWSCPTERMGQGLGLRRPVRCRRATRGPSDGAQGRQLVSPFPALRGPSPGCRGARRRAGPGSVGVRRQGGRDGAAGLGAQDDGARVDRGRSPVVAGTGGIDRRDGCPRPSRRRCRPVRTSPGCPCRTSSG